jgi:hypothetical protein
LHKYCLVSAWHCDTMTGMMTASAKYLMVS